MCSWILKELCYGSENCPFPFCRFRSQIIVVPEPTSSLNYSPSQGVQDTCTLLDSSVRKDDETDGLM